MKRFLILLFIFSSTSITAQNLALQDLFSLCNKTNWDEVNEQLLKKGWDFNDSRKGDDEHYNIITWTFNKDIYSDKAEGWLYLFTYEGYPNKITFTFADKTVYTKIKTGITAAGLKHTENSIEDNEIISVYTGTSFIVSVHTEKRVGEENYDIENSITAYSVIVIKKSGVYDNDNGKKIEYDANGHVKSEYFLTNGKINGMLKVYHENGNLLKVGSFLNGLENGKFVEYNERGSKTAEYTMINGEIEGPLTIFEDELKSQEINYKQGKKNGKYLSFIYNDNNYLQTKIVGEYLDDKKNGQWQTLLIVDGKEKMVEFTTYSKDLKNGAFSEYISSDSLETGFYKDGVLNGYYTLKTSTIAYEITDTEKEITLWNTECEGSYKNGLKDGRWIYYSLGNKIKEGNYKNGKETGMWAEYLVIGNHFGELYSETNYINGIKDGVYAKYFDCSTSIDSTMESFSVRFINTPVQETYYYSLGMKTGEYSLQDSTGTIMSKGSYLADKKNGLWIESYIVRDLNQKPIRIYNKGNYTNDKKTGKWQEYISEGSLLETQDYVDGVLDGKIVRLNENGKPSEVFYFLKGEMLYLEVFDSFGINILNKYQINSIKGKVINCLKTNFKDNIATTQGYEFISSFEDFNFYYFDFDFMQATSDTGNIVYHELHNSNTINQITYESTSSKDKGWKKEGSFEISDIKNNKILETGSYKNNKKHGVWAKYNYEIGVYMEQEFYADMGGIEKYYLINTKQLFSGKFIVKHQNSVIKYEFKISNGLRDGKSKYYNEKGTEIKTEKYEKGIIKS